MKPYDKVLDLGLYGYLEGTDRQSNGNTFFVDGNSGNAANISTGGQGSSWDLPFANINYAISQCSNNAGDVILVAANHTETIADTNGSNVSGTTTDELCVDKAGVTIIGLGRGTRRPKITLATATDACIDVRSPNCTLYNLIFYNTIDGNEIMIDVQAAAVGFTLENCMLYTSANDAEPLIHVNLTDGVTDVVIRGNRFYNVAGGDQAESAICAEGAVTRLVVEDNVFRGDWNQEVIQADTSAGYDFEIVDNVINNLDTAYGNVINLNASTTGVVKGNHIHCPLGSKEASVIADGCLVSDNYMTRNEGQDTVRVLGHNASDNVGNQWYVDSGVGKATGDGKSWESALSTVDAAINLCTADNNDVIHIAAGHAENVGTAGITCDKNGITFIGEGYGDARPTITFTTNAAAAVTVTSDDVRWENVRFACNIDNQTQMFDIDGDNCQIVGCEFVEGGQQPMSVIRANTGDGATHGNGLLVKNCRIYMPTADDADNAIELAGDYTGVRIEGNYIRGDFDEAVIEVPAAGNACVDLQIVDNVIINKQSGVHCIEIDVSALTVTGVCAGNILVNDTRTSSIQPNMLVCANNVWVDIGGNLQAVEMNKAGVTPGNNIYVDGSIGVDDTAHGTSWEFPLDTIDYAINLCTANNGDVIHVAPGHVEDLGDATIDFDKAGVTCIGYGNGLDMPQVHFNHANASIDIGADNVTLKNINLLPSITATGIGIDIETGVTNTLLENIHVLEGEAGNGTDDLAIMIDIKAACHDTIVRNCDFFVHASNDGDNAGIKLTGASDRCIFEDNIFRGPFQTACINGDTTLSKDLVIRRNVFYQGDTEPAIELLTGTTGIVARNYIKTNLATIAAAIDADAVYCFENWYNEDAGGTADGIEMGSATSVTQTADDA